MVQVKKSANGSPRILAPPLSLFWYILLLIFTCSRRWARSRDKVDLSPFWVYVIYAITLARGRQLPIKARCLNYLRVSLIPYCYQELQREVNGLEFGVGNPTRTKKTSSSRVVISFASLPFSSCVRMGTNDPGSWLLFPLHIILHAYDTTMPWFSNVSLTSWFWLVLLLLYHTLMLINPSRALLMAFTVLKCEIWGGHWWTNLILLTSGLGNSLGEKFQVTVHKTMMMHLSSPNYLTEESLGQRLRK